jgi:hypothetical protein
MMRQVSVGTLFALAVVVAVPVASIAADGRGPCEQIRAACETAGFARGAANMGVGLQVDCIIPIISGMPQRPRARMPLPQVSPQLVAECTASRPRFGRPGVPPPTEPISQPLHASPPMPGAVSGAMSGVAHPNDHPRHVRDAGAGSPARPDVSLPEAELLEPPIAPDCEFKSSTDIDDAAALRAMKLDYEQQCYRQSELILRARMERLQDAVKKTIGSVKGQETSAQ